MDKFYMVVGEAGKPVYAYNCTEFEKAERTAKKSCSDFRSDVFIMTATHVVVAPTPELTTTVLT